MGRILFIPLGLMAMYGGYLIDISNDDKVWIAIYPPPIEQIILEGLHYLLWLAGLVLIILGLISIFKKK